MNEFLLAKKEMGNSASFCHRLRHDLNAMSSMGNTYPNIFGVYLRGTELEPAMSSTYQKISDNHFESAFEMVKSDIVELLEAGRRDDYSVIENSRLNSAFRFKLLQVYFPEKYVPVISDGTLDEYCRHVNLLFPEKASFLEKNRSLRDWRKSSSKMQSWSTYVLMAFCDWLWRSDSFYDEMPMIVTSMSGDDNPLRKAVIPMTKDQELQRVQKLIERDFARKKLTIEELAKRAEAASASGSSTRTRISSGYYNRDPYIALYAKERAAGTCQLCGSSAPFNDENGRPYLESHHIVWLSAGGEDSIKNTVALCPNCHRKMHVVKAEDDIEKLIAVNSDL